MYARGGERQGNVTVILTISGNSGSGNTSTSRLLAQKMGLRLVHYTFRDYAQEHQIGFATVRKMAREQPDIDRYIDERQVELARRGNCIVASRLAIWLVRPADFSVYLYAPLSVRSRRIHQREHTGYLHTLCATFMRDRDDTRRYRRKYNINTKVYDFVDIVVDTRVYSVKQIVELIAEGVKEKVKNT